MSASKTIRVSEEHRELLHELKDVGDSYDDVIGELLEARQAIERRDLAERMRKVDEMDSDEFVPLDAGAE
jgi:predicted CopG family antitoxin